VSFEDWIFAFHLMSAATLVGSLVMSWIVVVSLLSAHTPTSTINLGRVGMVGTVTTVVGLVGAIAFGVWLAILREAYHVWDGWVIAALVLWAAYGGVGGRASKRYARARDRARALAAEGDAPSGELKALVRDPRALTLHVVSAGFVLLLLLDMIFKPGA
jgi:hypothetical protein